MIQTAFDLAKPRVIRSAEAHEAALRELDRLMQEDPPLGSEKGDQLELLALLIQDYEARTVKLGGTSTPQTIVEFAAEQHDLSSGELAELLGGRSSLTLFRQGRPLSKGQISRLNARLHIPIELLFEPTPIARGKALQQARRGQAKKRTATASRRRPG